MLPELTADDFDFLGQDIEEIADLYDSIKKTTECSIKTSTKTAYNTHTFGQKGWIKFFEFYNNHLNINPIVSHTPNFDSKREKAIFFLGLKAYFQIKCIEGFNKSIPFTTCENNKPVSKGTCWIMFSAIKFFYDQNGYSYSRNPLNDDDFKLYFSGLKGQLKQRDLLNGVQATRPLEYSDLHLLINNDFSNILSTRISQLWFKCMLSLGFCCFLRAQELLNIKMKDIKKKTCNMNIVYYEIVIFDRKVASSTPFVFDVYPNYNEPAANAFHYIDIYISELTRLELNTMDNFYFFGSYSGNDVKFSGSKSYQAKNFNLFFKQRLQDIKLNNVDYSTHALRKGGARFKLLHSVDRWNLDTVKIWASWSVNETRDRVLERYLICELGREQKYAAKKAMRDGMNAYSNSNQIKEVNTKIVAMHSKLSNFIDNTNPNDFCYATSHATTQIQPQQLASTTVYQHIAPKESTFLIKPNSFEKCIPWFISAVGSLEDVINQWNNAYDSRPPLKLWPACRRRGKEKSKFCQRKAIALLYNYYMSNDLSSLWIERYSTKGYGQLRTMYTQDPFYKIIKMSKESKEAIQCPNCGK